MRLVRNGRRDPWLAVLWLAVAILGPIALGLFIAGLTLAYEHYTTVCPAACVDNRLPAAAGAQWLAAGATMEQYAALMTALTLALALVCFGMAIFLLWRRPRDRMAVFVALMFILLGATFGDGDDLVGQQVTGLTGLIELINQGGFGLFPVLFLTFPDGRFVPRWSRWLALAILLISLAGLSAVGVAIPDPLYYLILPVWALAGPVSQVYRYRRISNPVQRQQIKWIATGSVLAMTGYAGTAVAGVLAGVPNETGPLAIMAVQIGVYFFIALIPITIAIGVLRYRLWDIDVIVRKTLVYTILTVLLAAVYFGTIIVLQTVFASVTGEQSPVVIVISTLVIAALFSPLRGRVQSVIDRRFFRQKYDADQVLAHFAEHARDEVEVEALERELLAAIQETVRPEQISIWLKGADERE
jgi:hypothetical protein